MRYASWLASIMVVGCVLLVTSCIWVFNWDKTDTYSGGGGAVAANSVSEFSVYMPEAAEVRKIERVALNGLFHPDAAALNIQLRHPGGLPVSLSGNRGDGMAFDGDYGFVDDSNADAVNNFVAVGGVVVEADYWASGDLDQYDEKDTLGTWELVITNSGGTVGSLDGWALTITYKEY